MEKRPLLNFNNVTLGYNRHPAVHHLNISIPKGTMTALVGPNGAGKSTLLKGIMHQLTPLEGNIEIDGITQDDIAYLPQQAKIDRQFPICVWDFAAMGLWREIGAFKGLNIAQRSRIDTAIKTVLLNGFERRQIGTLSGGQFQRLLFARMLLQNADLLLLDEPFIGVDETNQKLLLNLLQQWHEQGRTIIAVLHNLEHVKSYFPDALLLARRMIAYGSTAAVLTQKNLEEARHLEAAFDDNAPICEEEITC